MIKNLNIALLFFFLYCSCGNSQDVAPILLKIEFDGFKKEYYKKYNLWTEINDSLLIHEITTAIDTSKILLLCPSTTPVMWQIDVFAEYPDKEEYQLFKINSNTYRKLSLQKKGRCYDNSRLVEMLMKIVKVEEIGRYSGAINQNNYNQIINELE